MTRALRPLIALALALVASTAFAAASESERWHYLPRVVYLGEDLHLHVELPAGWSLERDGQAVTGARQRWAAGAWDEVRVLDASGQVRRRVVAVEPGSAHRLQVDGLRLVTADGALAVLRLERREYAADRRWELLRGVSAPAPRPCTTRVELDAAVAWGEPALLHLVAAATASEWRGGGAVLVLPSGDRAAGWPHREYRQVLAWLVDHAQCVGMRRVVLVEPPAPANAAAELAGLRAQVADVARSYHAESLAIDALAAERYWSVAEGLVGTELNAAGRALRAERIASLAVPTP